MAPIYAILCGREPKLVEFMKSNLAPTIEITHVCSSTEAALSDMPTLLLPPKSDNNNNKPVSIVLVGGLYAPDDIEKIKAAADATRPVPFFVADRSKIPPGATGPPPADIIKQRILAAVEAARNADGMWEPVMHKY